MQHWITARLGRRTDSYGMELKEAKDDELDRLAWVLRMQRKFIYVP